MLRSGKLDGRYVELEITNRNMPMVEIFSSAGLEEMEFNIIEVFGNIFPAKKKKRRVKMTRIMHVDNEIFTLKVVGQILEDGGFDVESILSGSECLSKLKTERPDLILLDIMMPNMSGWDMAKQIKSDDALKNIKVIMLTARQTEPNIELMSFCDGYIAKPFEKDELLEKIEAILAIS